MKSKFKYLIIGIILLPHFLLAQTYLDTICWITVEKPGYYATNGENFTADENLNTLLQSTDGFKDYDEVVIEVQQFWLKDITPNPTASTTNISYQIEGASSAYLMVLNGFGTVNNNYIITPNSNQVILDVSGYTPGVYNVILIVDGQAVDAKSLVVQ